MRKYLSFGGGVNSVALYLYLVEQGEEFEAVFVHHGTDWPETYDYVAGFQWWLKRQGLRPIKVLTPEVRTNDGKIFTNLYSYYNYKKFFPSRQSRACTDRWKVRTLEKYQKPPAWVYIGYASDEAHRAKIQSANGLEFRFPLIEAEIDRQGCMDIIKSHGLPVPMKSGCYFCPWQGRRQFMELRTHHPDLFCRAKTIEDQYNARRFAEGKKPIYIKDKPLSSLVGENQMQIFEQDEYPPCQCGL